MDIAMRTLARVSRAAFGATLFLSAALLPLALAADQITFLTSWFAQAEHGGFYQAKATGLYEKADLDVTIKMGGPQINGIQLARRRSRHYYGLRYPSPEIDREGSAGHDYRRLIPEGICKA